jgi:hypothetical protein
MDADGFRALTSTLLPRPHAIDASGPARAVPRHFAVRAPPDVDTGHVIRTARSHFESAGCTLLGGTASGSDSIQLSLALTHTLDAQSYRLRSSPREITIEGGDAAGLSYGVTTLAQIVSGCIEQSAPFPSLTIDDRPDFPRRGFLLDISRSKVPTQATLFDLVDRMAYLKLNELQLYTEHTFAYRDHETVWRDSSPLTGEEIDALDRHCRERHIELVPNQQSLGHMHRWLKHERYRHLAEVPEGITHAFSRDREPYGLCATDPKSLVFLESLYDELLPHFSSSRFNVGLDEPVDLGLDRSKAACAERGTQRVYVDFVCAVAERVRARGRRMEMWADIVVKEPALARDIPADVHLLEWGYEADHPFGDHLAVLAESGHTFSVCPGTSSWQSIAGRTQNALANLRSAAQSGKAAGATGYLITDWGDRGHLQPLSVSYAGILAGAACAWNAESASPADFDLAAELDRHAFRDDAGVLGQVATRLGDVYRTTGASSTNGSALFFLLAFADEALPHARMPGLRASDLETTSATIRELRATLEHARPRAQDAALIVDEMRWAADLLAFACRLGVARLGAQAGASARDLSAELAPLVALHGRLWNARNRPGGRVESVAWLTRVAESL